MISYISNYLSDERVKVVYVIQVTGAIKMQPQYGTVGGRKGILTIQSRMIASKPLPCMQYCYMLKGRADAIEKWRQW